MQKLFENFRKFLNEAPKEDNYETELVALKQKMKDSPQRYIETYDGDVLDLKYNPDTVGFDKWVEDGWKWFGDRELVFRWDVKGNQIYFNFNEILERIRDPKGKRTKYQLTLSEKDQAAAYLKQKFDVWFKTNGPTVSASKEAIRTRDLITHYAKKYDFVIPLPYTSGGSGIAYEVFKDLQKEIKANQVRLGDPEREKIIQNAVDEWFEYGKYSKAEAPGSLFKRAKRPMELETNMQAWLKSQLILGAEVGRDQPYPGWNPGRPNARKVAEKVAGYYREALDDPRIIDQLETRLGRLAAEPRPEQDDLLSQKEVKRLHKRISDAFPTKDDPGTLFRIYQKIYQDPYTAMQKIVKQGQGLPRGAWPIKTAWHEVVSQRDGGWNKLPKEQQKELIDRMVAIEMDRTYRLTTGKNPIIKNFDHLLAYVETHGELTRELGNVPGEIDRTKRAIGGLEGKTPDHGLAFIDKQSTELATLDKKANKSWFRKFLRKLPFFSAGFVGVLFPYDEAQAAFNRGILRKQGVLEPWRPEISGGKKGAADASLEDIVEEGAQLARILFGNANDPQAEFKTLLIVESLRAVDPGVELTELALNLVIWMAKKTPLEATDLITKALGGEYLSGPQTQDIEDYPELGQAPSWAHGDKGEKEEIGPVPPKEDLQEMKIIFENWRGFVSEDKDNTALKKKYESVFPVRKDRRLVKTKILKKLKSLKRKVYFSAIKGEKRRQYERAFGKEEYAKALPALKNVIKNIKFKIMLGWDPSIDPEHYQGLLNNLKNAAGAATVHEQGREVVIIFADQLIKNNQLQTYLDTTLYHEVLGHIVPETFEKATGIVPGQKQWKPAYHERDELTQGLWRALRKDCLKKASSHAIKGAKQDDTVLMIKELHAQVVAMAAKGFTRKDFLQLCKDQKEFPGAQFRLSLSYKKYGGIAKCINCSRARAATTIKTIQNIAAAGSKGLA